MARVLSFQEHTEDPQRRPATKSRPGPQWRPPGFWFGWWVALCLVILAWSTQQQLSIQHRLLASSRELEQVVAESRAVSAETNRQLTAVQALDAATARMDLKLARVAQVNTDIKAELSSLEGTAVALARSVTHLDAQAAESYTLLSEIGSRSAALKRTLQEARALGDEVHRYLGRLLQEQETVNADLSEINRKTRLMERIGGGGAP